MKHINDQHMIDCILNVCSAAWCALLATLDHVWVMLSTTVISLLFIIIIIIIIIIILL